MTTTPTTQSHSVATPSPSRTSTATFAISEPAAQEPRVDDAAHPREHGGDDRDVVVGAAVEALGEAEQDEHDDRPREFDGDEAVDRPPHERDREQRHERDEERG